jgi:hypothetical protein
MTYDGIMRARVDDLLSIRGLSPTGAATALGRGKCWLHRKLRDVDDRRPLFTEDVDRVLELLGLEPLDVFDPVLEAADVRIFRWIGRTTPTFEEALLYHDEAKRSLDRLRRQGLVREVDGRVALSALGRRYTNRPIKPIEGTNGRNATTE